MAVELIRELEGPSPKKVEVRCSYCHKVYELDKGNFTHRTPKSCKNCISLTKLNVDGTKTCSRCKLPKPVSDYTVTNKEFGSLKSKCKVCVQAVDRERFQNNPIEEKARRAKMARKCHLMKEYNLTLEDYDTMVSAADSSCQICNKKVNYNLHVDHCHSTNTVRGLLCNECNSGIGMLGDTASSIRAALVYLEGFENGT